MTFVADEGQMCRLKWWQGRFWENRDPESPKWDSFYEHSAELQATLVSVPGSPCAQGRPIVGHMLTDCLV